MFSQLAKDVLAAGTFRLLGFAPLLKGVLTEDKT